MPSAGQISFVHDQTRMRWMTSLTSGRFQPPLVLPEGDTIDFVFRWSNNGTLYTPPVTPVWIFGIKDATTPSGDFLVQVNSASANAGVYTFTVPISSAELQAWLATATSQSYAAIQITDTANGIATTPLLCQITPNQNDSGTTPTSANGVLNVAAGKTVTFPLSLTFPSAAGTNGQQLTLSNSTTGLLEWAASGGITDGDKGDITVTASGATWTIDAGVVTLAKMADMATNRIIGRTSVGNGAPELLTISGTGSVAMTGSPTFTGTIGGAEINITGTILADMCYGSSGVEIGPNASYIFGDSTAANFLYLQAPAGVFATDKTQTLQNADGTIALVTKKRTFITASDILLYNSGGFCSFSAQGTTFQGAYMPDAADTTFQILLDPAEWGGRAAKVTVVFVGNVSSTANVNFDVGLDWKTTAIDGATNSMAGPGWGAGGGSPVQNLNQAGPATQPYPQKFTSQQWNITAGATFLSLWLKRNGTTDAYAGNISVLWISIDEQ